MKSVVLSTFAFLLFSSVTYGKGPCGEDNRNPSKLPQVGILHLKSSGVCTATLIGRSCALTAGHCADRLDRAYFNLKFSSNGLIQLDPNNYYDVDQSATVSSTGIGHDYAVIRLKKNQFSQLYPGDTQGFLPINFRYRPQRGEFVTVSGHGVEESSKGIFIPQKEHQGPIMRTQGSLIYHRVDTSKGDSGAAIVSGNGEIIGIHTSGGCEVGRDNRGVLISRESKLKRAIRQCLAWEKSL